MMPKKLISVGVEIPGGDIENVTLASDQSLLDSDIIIFKPGIPYLNYHENYKGRPCLTDDASFRSRQALSHWRKELIAAYDADKLIVVLLSRPELVYAATGQVTYSGTGRNARGTRVVDELSSYQAIPVNWKFYSASGREMIARSEARFLRLIGPLSPLTPNMKLT